MTESTPFVIRTYPEGLEVLVGHQCRRVEVHGSSGAARILKERARQIVVEGYGLDHDDDHDPEDLLKAAVAYLTVGGKDGEARVHIGGVGGVAFWPWDRETWKPSDDPIRNLTKAGALIAAAIDRQARADEEAERTRQVEVRRDDLQTVLGFVLALEHGPPYPAASDIRKAVDRLREASE